MSQLFLGTQSDNQNNKIQMLLSKANRHGLIAGATGTGKTVTLQTLAEGFSAQGVPVFLADVKGDLSGLCAPSASQDFILKRNTEIGVTDFKPTACPTLFWDLFAQKGHAVKATLSEIGPLLLARMLDLNDTQEGVLQIAFRVADDDGLLILDLKDLRALLNYVADNDNEISKKYGNVAPQSIAAIQRALLQLEEQGGDQFFGEPALNLMDFMRTSYDGRGFVNILAADKLMQSPRLYATFLLWMLSELFENLPEAGDTEKPKLVFFFDEAHLLFKDAPKNLLEKIEQVVRLIRSKAVGVYFITQSPNDIPETVSAQLGNRVQHSLRAFTQGQKKDIKAAADGFRANTHFKVEDVIEQMRVGEALVSVLDEKGIPTEVQRVLIKPPLSKIGPADATQIQAAIQNSPVAQQYAQQIDRESAYEILVKRAETASDQAEQAQQKADQAVEKASPNRAPSRKEQSTGEVLMKSVVRAASSQVGRQVANALVRGLLGGLSRRR
jgi:uncharacterized protein